MRPLLASLLLAASCGGAGGPAEAGEPCDLTADCVEGTQCVATARGDEVSECMLECAAGDRLCADLSACLPLAGGGGHVCYTGGVVPLNGSCTGSTECMGGACADVGGDLRCRRPCPSGDATPCVTGEICAPLAEGDPDGFCVPEAMP